MKQRALVLGLSMALLAAPVAEADACGESLMRLGQGLRYQVYQAKHPATVLVYVGPNAPVIQADALETFVASLRRAGHRVTVADGDTALTPALQQQSFDVVLTAAGDADAVSARAGDTGGHPVVVPVVGQRSDAGSLRTRYAHVLHTGDSFGRYLRVLNQVMASRTG